MKVLSTAKMLGDILVNQITVVMFELKTEYLQKVYVKFLPNFFLVTEFI